MSPFVQQLIGSFIGTSLAILIAVIVLALIDRKQQQRRRAQAERSAAGQYAQQPGWYSDSDAVNGMPDE